MFKWLINILKKTEVPRSPEWPTCRKHFLKKNPTCAACGTTDNLNVHHKMPFHLDKSKELDNNNLITLCETHCHILIGHLASFKSYNPDVVEDAVTMLKKVQNRPRESD